MAVRMAILFLLLGGDRPGRRCPPLPELEVWSSEGGTVVGADGRPRADVAVRAGHASSRVAATRRGAPRAPACSTPVAAWSGPAWSTCTPTCASPAARRPRRSRPAPVRPPSAATPPSWPCPTPSRPSTRPASPARCSTWAGARTAEVAVAGAITVGRAGERLAPARRAGRARGARSSPTTAPACRTAALMRRALDYAKGLGVTLAQHCEDACLAGGGAMHEGPGRAGWGSRACPRRPRRPWWPATSRWPA